MVFKADKAGQAAQSHTVARLLGGAVLASSTTEVRAYCGVDGVIFFADEVPQGFIEIVRGDPKQVRATLAVVARHGYTPGVLLVPGVPEAEGEKEALLALHRWLDWCARCNNGNDSVLTWNVTAKVTL